MMKYSSLIRSFFTGFMILFLCSAVYAQNYWQQAVDYEMEIDFDVSTHQFKGTQQLIYTNNSPDTLTKVFYHLYFNAFQPGSMMDTRSRTIEDPDGRVMDRISKLSHEEIGYHKVLSLKQNNADVDFIVEGTVLEVELNESIIPGGKSTFAMEFESQVPAQIRRSGRNSAEGISYSMAQWFPKLAEYDERGWHAHPYVGREFYAPWGDYKVTITIDKRYILAGTGLLENKNQIGYGYEDEGTVVRRKGKKLTWKFRAENVHDFVWAADPDYTHMKRTMKNGPELHFFYQKGEETKAWEELPELTEKAFAYIQEHFGEYPYPQYSVIQGGDGGMEYPMATLITGHRNLQSLVGVTVHEAFHSWYQGLLATNESYYAWMDEGFTTYGTAETMAYLFRNSPRSQQNNYRTYIYLATSGKEEPLSTHADHFKTNFAYSLGSYYKGAIALAQMNYLVGTETTKAAQKKYYYQWRFKHPDANDWIRVFEKESGLELDWYLDYWVNTTHSIDYAVDKVKDGDNTTMVHLKKVGEMPMPLDVYVTYADGTQKLFYIPLGLMRGEKENDTTLEREILPDWPWVHSSYSFQLDTPMTEISAIEIDASQTMADVDRENNKWEK